MKLEENFFKSPEDENFSGYENVHDLIRDRISEKYPDNPEKVNELMDILDENFSIHQITDPEDLEDLDGKVVGKFKAFDDDEDAGCPVVDFIEDLLESSYDPKPFGISWTDEDIIQFLEEYGYFVIQEVDDLGHSMAFKSEDEYHNICPNGEFNYNYDFKKVFIKLCRQKSIKMLLKAFKELD